MLITRQTGNKNGGRLVGTAGLHLVIGAVFGLAARTGEHRRGSADLVVQFGGVAFDFAVN